MPKFRVIVDYSIIRNQSFYVEANSEEEAKEKVNEKSLLNNNFESGWLEEYVNSYEVDDVTNVND